jgi:hypothetical protein
LNWLRRHVSALLLQHVDYTQLLVLGMTQLAPECPAGARF